MASVKKEMRLSAKIRAKEILAREGNRMKLSAAVVICASLTIIMWLLSGLSDIVLDIFGVGYEYLYYPVSILTLVCLVVYLVAPVYVGTFRMSLKMLNGEETEIADIFEVFSSFKAYNRALRVSFGMLLKILPIIIALRIHAIIDYLSYWLVFFDETIIALDILFIPIALLLVIFVCRPFGYVSFAYFDESQKLRNTRKLARKSRKGNHGSILALAYATLFKLILSLFTFGILTIVHTIPLSMLTYGAMAEQIKQNYETKCERTDI